MLPPVIKTIEVPCTPEKAFTVFAEDLAKWWPRDKHSVSAMQGKVARAVTLEPRAGGQLSELTADGEEVIWGSVAAYDPFARLAFNWHIARPADEATTVDISFEASGTGTRVTLTHSGWEVFGEEAKAMHDGYASGWVFVFETCYRAACGTVTA